MKKTLVFLSVILFILLSEIIFKILPFYIQPNLWIPYVVFAGLFLSHLDAVKFGLFVGVVFDILHFTTFGTNIFLFSTVGYFLGWFNKNMDERLTKVQILSLMMGIFIYYVAASILNFFELVNFHFNIYRVLTSSLVTILVGYLEMQLLYRYYNKLHIIK